jgi:hypothetical protein
VGEGHVATVEGAEAATVGPRCSGPASDGERENKRKDKTMMGTVTPGKVWIDGETYLRALRILANNATTGPCGRKEGISLDLQGMLDSFLEQAPSFTGRAVGRGQTSNEADGGPAEPGGEDAGPAPSPMPAYVERLYWTLRHFSNSPRIKMQLAEIFSRQLDALREGYDADWRSSIDAVWRGERGAVSNFTTAEKVGVLCCALSEKELRAIMAQVEAMLVGSPAQGDKERWPVSA